jgi:hypothetical protein
MCEHCAIIYTLTQSNKTENKMLILETTVETDAELTITEHAIDMRYKLLSGASTTLTHICVVTERDDDGEHTSTLVNVTHTNEDEDFAMDLYDNNKLDFEALISYILKLNICFTESGMQDDGHASMELG